MCFESYITKKNKYIAKLRNNFKANVKGGLRDGKRDNMSDLRP